MLLRCTANIHSIERKELVHLHAVENGESLSDNEVRIIKGAIDMKEKTVGECQTTVDKVFAISIDTKLDRETLQRSWTLGITEYPYITQAGIISLA